MSSSVHVDNKGKDILILGKGPIHWLHGTTSTAESLYSINFTQSRKGFALSLHYDESNIFLFANATKIYQPKAKYSEIKHYSLRLGNVSKHFTTNYTKKTKEL